MGHGRRRSDSSSSSSSSSSSGSEKKFKKDKKDKKNKYGGAAPGLPTPSHQMPFGQAPLMPSMPSMSSMPIPGMHGGSVARGTSPAPPSHAIPPPSGYRVPLSDGTPFPHNQAGAPAAYDGQLPVFLGSAIYERAVHPCKIIPTFTPPARVAYGGSEQDHYGRYDLLPFDPNTMVWVATSNGQIPAAARPVEGGYEENGEKLYHALAQVNGVMVPGKTGVHLVSATRLGYEAYIHRCAR